MTEPANTAQNALTVAQPTAPAPKPSLSAGAKPLAIVPVDFDGAWRMATAIVRGGITPYGLETPEKVMIALLAGLEVGMTPMAATQSIAIINNRPLIYGDSVVGLVRASGLLEWMKEHFEGEGDKLKAVCVVKRKNDPEVITGEFSVEDAKVSGLWTKTGKNGSKTPWQLYPKRMLKVRARAFAFRDGFADVLKGLSIREEMEDVERLDAPSQAAPVVPPPPVEEQMQQQQQVEETAVPPPPEDEAASGEITEEERGWLNELGGAYSGCEDSDSLSQQQIRVMMPMKDKVSAAAWAAAQELTQEHVERISSDE